MALFWGERAPLPWYRTKGPVRNIQNPIKPPQKSPKSSTILRFLREVFTRKPPKKNIFRHTSVNLQPRKKYLYYANKKKYQKHPKDSKKKNNQQPAASYLTPFKTRFFFWKRIEFFSTEGPHHAHHVQELDKIDAAAPREGASL